MKIESEQLIQVQKPSRYVGGEVGSIIKNDAEVSLNIALAFPDVYEIGMSHQGLKILYAMVNQRADYWAERVMAPWLDMEKMLRDEGRPLSSLESGRPLGRFDVVGFSLQYELSYTNILNMLDMARIPLYSTERSEEHPLVIGGGPNAYNPEPIADFFDMFYLGDAEAGLMDVLDEIKEWKQAGGSRGELLERLRHRKGIYVPSFFAPRYDGRGRLVEIEPLRPGYDHVDRAVLPELETAVHPVHPVVPFTQIVHDRIAFEISRGCTRGCRFCQAGFIYRPVRERKPDTILNIVRESLKSTGQSDISFLSLSAGDYSCLTQLMTAFMDVHGPRHVSLSLPSLRVKSLTPEVMAQIKRVRKTGFTIAPEAGTQRLRDVINKDLTEDDLFFASREAFKMGWRLIKLYFMIGLPTETDEDVTAIADLARRLQAGTRGKVNVSFATFVPKNHTPFQWERMLDLNEMKRRMGVLRNSLRTPGLNPKWNEAESSLVEGVLSRGDRRLSRVLMNVHKRGGRFDAWSEQMNLGMWMSAMADEGLSLEEYLRERDRGETLPWSHLRIGASMDYLWKERERAYHGDTTKDCRFGACTNCGVCDFKTIGNRICKPEEDSPEMEKTILEPEEPVRFNVFFEKTGRAKVLGHLEVVDVFMRAVRRAGLNFKMSEGFHPQPKISFLTPLAVGQASVDEIMMLELMAPPEEDVIKDLLNRELPEGFAITGVRLQPKGAPKPRARGAAYQIEVGDDLFDEEKLKISMSQEKIPVSKRSKKGMIELNLKSLLGPVQVLTSRRVELTLYSGERGALRPDQAIGELFDLAPDRLKGIQITKTETILG